MYPPSSSAMSAMNNAGIATATKLIMKCGSLLSAKYGSHLNASARTATMRLAARGSTHFSVVTYSGAVRR